MTEDRRKPFMAEIQRQKRNGSSGFAPADRAALLAPVVAALPAPQDNRHDSSEVLEAINALGHKLDRFLTSDHTQIEAIHVELSDIAGRIKATKVEMAALRHPLAKEDTFLEASQHLAAIVASTESATNTIIQAAEEVDDIASELRAQISDGYQSSRLKDLHEATLKIFEACNFQDLTGQRITKVIQTMTFIEERVNSMMSLWNSKEFEAMPLPPSLHKKDEGLELHGPGQDKSTISQSDIDALFD